MNSRMGIAVKRVAFAYTFAFKFALKFAFTFTYTFAFESTAAVLFTGP